MASTRCVGDCESSFSKFYRRTSQFCKPRLISDEKSTTCLHRSAIDWRCRDIFPRRRDEGDIFQLPAVAPGMEVDEFKSSFYLMNQCEDTQEHSQKEQIENRIRQGYQSQCTIYLAGPGQAARDEFDLEQEPENP